MEIEEKSESKKRFSDILPKILSLIAAVFLWVYVMYAKSPLYEGNFSDITVDLYGISEIGSTYGLSAIYGSQQTIEVCLSGEKSVISSLSPEDIYTYVDVSDISAAGSYRLDVHINAPSGVTVKNYAPDSISIYLDKSTSKIVPVKTVKSSVTLAEGLSIGTVTTDNEYVTVTGPDEFVKKVAAAQLNLSLGELSSSTSFTDKLVLVGADGEEISNPFTKTSPSSVTATVPLKITKSVPLEVDFIHGYFNSSNSSVTVFPSAVKLSMPIEQSNSITKLTLATIDETHIISNTTLQSQINLPVGVESTEGVSTAQISISLKDSETKKFTVKKDRIAVTNVPDGYKCTISTPSVSFVMRGPVGTVENMAVTDFDAVIDLEGNAIEGMSSVPVTVSSEVDGVYMLNADENVPTVMVTLEKINGR